MSKQEVIPPKDLLVSTYRWMLLGRVLDEKLASLYRGGKIVGGVYLGLGQEALSAAIGVNLREGDTFSPLIRDQAGRLAFGEPTLEVARTFLGSRLGPMRGRDGNIHRGVPSRGQLAMISHLGAMISAVAGVLLADRLMNRPGTVGVASIGDGGTSTGAFHEGLNMAAVEQLPLVVVVANNQFAYSTPNNRQFRCEDLVNKAAGYGVAGHTVDGTDPIACLNVVGRAIEQARNGGGPQLVVAKLLRLCGHGEHDDGSYADPALRQQPYGQDCIEVGKAFLIAQKIADEAMIASWKQKAVAEVEESVAIAQRDPLPDPITEDWCALATRSLAEGVHDTEDEVLRTGNE